MGSSRGSTQRLVPVVAGKHFADPFDAPVVNDVLEAGPFAIAPVAVIAEELDDLLGDGHDLVGFNEAERLGQVRESVGVAAGSAHAAADGTL